MVLRTTVSPGSITAAAAAALLVVLQVGVSVELLFGAAVAVALVIWPEPVAHLLSAEPAELEPLQELRLLVQYRAVAAVGA